MKKYEGSCGCGSIEYSFDGEPINAVFCYCKECQIHTGSDKWFGLWVLKDNFSFTKGTPVSFARMADSGNDVKMLRCGICGTLLCSEGEAWGLYSVSASTVKNGYGVSPKMAIYTASASSWAVFPEGVPKFDQHPPDLS